MSELEIIKPAVHSDFESTDVFGYVSAIQIGSSTVRLVYSGAWIKFPYNRKIINIIKSYDYRFWDYHPDTKTWFVHRTIVRDVLITISLPTAV